MELSLHEFVIQRLLATPRARWPEIAGECGISFHTVKKIAYRDIDDPGVSHIEKLARHFGRDPLAITHADA